MPKLRPRLPSVLAPMFSAGTQQDAVMRLNRGRWNRDLVGRKGYPTTEAIFLAKQARNREDFLRNRPTHRGWIKGWTGRLPELWAIREAAMEHAWTVVAKLKEKAVVAEDINPRAELALATAVAVIEAKDDKGHPVEPTKDRLAAARLLLDFTMSKPVAKSDVTIKSAEDFLEQLV